jgi:hypothetical protein
VIGRSSHLLKVLAGILRFGKSCPALLIHQKILQHLRTTRHKIAQDFTRLPAFEVSMGRSRVSWTPMIEPAIRVGRNVAQMLSRANNFHPKFIRQALRLAFLAPEVTSAI